MPADTYLVIAIFLAIPPCVWAMKLIFDWINGGNGGRED